MTALGRIAEWRILAVIAKEFRQIRRNRRLMVMLIVPPTIQIVLFGYALNPEVSNLRLGVVDESRTYESRELISKFPSSQSFQIVGYFGSSDELGEAIRVGRLDAGLVIPTDYAERLIDGRTAEIQILLDATNSNTATIAGGYAARIVADANRHLVEKRRSRAGIQSSQLRPGGGPEGDSGLGTVEPAQLVAPAPMRSASVAARIALFYNAGLDNAWFITTGLIGLLLVLIGSIVAAASMVKEKETGTIEQLLMTPASATEIIIAKMAPLLLLLSGDIILALVVCRLVFDVPIRGNLFLLVFAGMLCVFAGIGIGIFVATFTKSQQQAQLMSFFINPPVALLSGAMTPIEAMPEWMQTLTYINPVRHFATISRGVMLKGAGIDVLYPNLLFLVLAAVVLVGVSVWRFRKQLG